MTGIRNVLNIYDVKGAADFFLLALVMGYMFLLIISIFHKHICVICGVKVNILFSK